MSELHSTFDFSNTFDFNNEIFRTRQSNGFQECDAPGEEAQPRPLQLAAERQGNSGDQFQQALREFVVAVVAVVVVFVVGSNCTSFITQKALFESVKITR